MAYNLFLFPSNFENLESNSMGLYVKGDAKTSMTLAKAFYEARLNFGLGYSDDTGLKVRTFDYVGILYPVNEPIEEDTKIVDFDSSGNQLEPKTKPKNQKLKKLV